MLCDYKQVSEPPSALPAALHTTVRLDHQQQDMKNCQVESKQAEKYEKHRRSITERLRLGKSVKHRWVHS